MMKRLIYLSLLLLVIVGCKKDRDVAPGERPEERMAFALTELRENLLSAPYGWNAYMTTAQGSGFSFYFDFDEGDRVISLSDFDDETSSIPFESGYRLRAVMSASLLFDTYSYIHLLADPNPSVAGGTAARGYNTDFEFEYYGSGENDSLLLVGKTRRMPFFMMPATQSERTQYMNGEFTDRIAAMNTYINSNANLYFEINSDLTPAFLFNIGNKTVISSINVDGEDLLVNMPYVYTLSGVRFPAPLFIGTDTLTHIDLTSPTTAKAVMRDGTEYDMGNSETPLLPLRAIFNYNGTFNTVASQGTALPAIVGTSSFTDVWNSVVNNVTSSGNTLRDFEFVISSNSTINVNVYYTTSANFTATMTFNYTYEDGLLTLSNPTGNTSGNWNTRRSWLQPLENYLLNFANNQIPLSVEWVSSTDGSLTGGLVSTEEPSDILYGFVR